MNPEPANFAAAALCRRLRTRWCDRPDLRAEVTDGGVAIYWRGECVGTWLAADRQYQFRPVGGKTNGIVAHTILGAFAFTEGIIRADD